MNVFREGKVHVRKEMCATCIFRPGNLMKLTPGRVAGMVEDAEKNQSAIICHDTLHTKRNAVCRGFFERHQTLPLALAQAMGTLTEQE